MNFLPKERYGFYKPDLRIEYTVCDNEETPEDFLKTEKEYYQILYIFSGKYKIIANTKTFLAEQGNLIISNRNEKFEFQRKTKTSEFITIYFQDSLFDFFPKDEFLRSFQEQSCGTCLLLKSFKNLTCYELFNSLKNCLINRRSKLYMKIIIQAIIAEIDFNYDEVYKVETFDKSNKVLNILEFVRNNYNQPISLKTIREKFYVSDSTINRIFLKSTGLPFKKHLNLQRIISANEMIKAGNDSLLRIAELNGFETYSTFYREYLKKYGIAPIKNAPKKNSLPLIK